MVLGWGRGDGQRVENVIWVLNAVYTIFQLEPSQRRHYPIFFMECRRLERHLAFIILVDIWQSNYFEARKQIFSNLLCCKRWKISQYQYIYSLFSTIWAFEHSAWVKFLRYFVIPIGIWLRIGLKHVFILKRYEFFMSEIKWKNKIWEKYILLSESTSGL